MIIAKSMADIDRYYNKKTNTYDFKDEMGRYVAVKIDFDLTTTSNIISHNIEAKNIKARNILAADVNCQNILAENIRVHDIIAANILVHSIFANDIRAIDICAHNIAAKNIVAWDIKSMIDIDADNINFFAVCFAYRNITYHKIKGFRNNSKCFVLDGKITVK